MSLSSIWSSFQPILSPCFGWTSIDGIGPSTTLKEDHPQRHLGPTTRAMTKRLDEDWDKATDGRKTYLYMFQEAQHQV